MQAAKDFVATSSVIQGIVSLFESKPEIKADTPIMGLPMWSLMAGAVVYIVWNNQKYNKLSDKVDALVAKVSEIERDDKDAMRHEISELRKKLVDAGS